MAKQVKHACASLALCAFLAQPLSAQLPNADEATLAQIEADVTRAEAVEAIKRVTYMFGYYRDARMYDAAQSLFTDDATYDFIDGQYVGKSSIVRLFGSKRFNPEGAVRGQDNPAILNDHAMLQPVITLDADGQGAWARFKELVFEGMHGKSQTYALGVYENRYRKDSAGKWKISGVRYCYRLRMPYQASIFTLPDRPVTSPVPTFYPKDPEGPDRQISFACHLYPDVGLNPPFHFNHPVTGEHLQKP